MKTVQEQETEAILNLGNMHEEQREVIFRMRMQMDELESKLAMAQERVAYLEAQVYGGSTK